MVCAGAGLDRDLLPPRSGVRHLQDIQASQEGLVTTSAHTHHMHFLAHTATLHAMTVDTGYTILCSSNFTLLLQPHVFTVTYFL